MRFAQLYYTSCETGLSGFAGFQFNAVTPGLTPELLRTVESLTAYKPPRWVSPRPAARRSPRARSTWCISPSRAPILARVVFIGLDFSQRSGNYFAHALVSQELVGFGEILPIELWESPIWVSKPVSDTELRVLHELPPSAQGSGLSRVEVDRFARDAGRAEPLAALLTAAEDAILRDGRPIVIVHPDTAVAARWIGAVSYLLPRAVARRLTFATYHHNPGYVDVHMIGTVPDSDFGLTRRRSSATSCFECDRRAPAMSRGTWQAAALLVRAGPQAARRRCGQAAAARRRRRRAMEALDDWHPALVMAALVRRPRGRDRRPRRPQLPGCRGTRPDAPRSQAADPPVFLDNAARAGPGTWPPSGYSPDSWPTPRTGRQRIEHLAVTEELRRAVGSAR